MRVGEVGFQSVLCKSFNNILENMIGTLLWLPLPQYWASSLKFRTAYLND